MIVRCLLAGAIVIVIGSVSLPPILLHFGTFAADAIPVGGTS